MVYLKRLLLCTVLGFIMGFLCYQGGKSVGVEFTFGMTLATIFNRALIGFTIGISAWKMPFWLHGMLLGILVSLPMGFGGLEMGGFVPFVAFGALWGILIELIVTLVFKAPMKRFQGGSSGKYQKTEEVVTVTKTQITESK